MTKRAASREKNTCTATVMPNCLKNCPAMPDMKLAGAKIAMMVSEIAITASPISSAASIAAWTGDLPMRMWRTMFSISTIESSTRMPVESVMARKLTRFSEKPSRSIAQKAGKIDSGSETATITVARKSRRNRNTMTTARNAPSNRVEIAAS